MINSLKIIGETKDLRTNTHILYAQISITDYLKLVGKDFDRFDIQRKRVNPKAYKRLKEDIQKGALLPTITLAINPKIVRTFTKYLNPKNNAEIIKRLNNPDNIYILDGLQRTHIINDIIIKEKKKLNTNQKLLLEIWFESKLPNLIYRLIVLNAGQKPMSMRHQIDLLFMTIKDQLEEEIPGLEIYKEKDGTIRNKPKKFAFDKLVTAYYSYTLKTPEVSREHIVTTKMEEASILDSDEVELENMFEGFKNYLQDYCTLDEQVYRIYSQDAINKSFKNLLSEENFINSFFAVLAQYGENEKNKVRIKKAITKLKNDLKKAKPSSDPLALFDYQKYRQLIDPKVYNVGFGTRKLISTSLKEYFREEGEIDFKDCWGSGYEFLREKK
jgi:hypothetical protein